MKSFGDVYIHFLMLTNRVALFRLLMSQGWYEGMLKEWAACCGTDRRRILEIGCGPGLLSIALSADHEVHGADKSAAMVDEARRTGHRQNGGAQFVCTDMSPSPFGDDMFDWVLGASLVNIVPDPKALLLEARRVTKLGGHVSFLVPTTRMNARSAAAFIRAHRLSGVSAALLRTWATMSRKMDAAALIDLLSSAGFAAPTPTAHLDGMVVSVTATKSNVR